MTVNPWKIWSGELTPMLRAKLEAYQKAHPELHPLAAELAFRHLVQHAREEMGPLAESEKEVWRGGGSLRDLARVIYELNSGNILELCRQAAAVFRVIDPKTGKPKPIVVKNLHKEVFKWQAKYRKKAAKAPRKN